MTLSHPYSKIVIKHLTNIYLVLGQIRLYASSEGYCVPHSKIVDQEGMIIYLFGTFHFQGQGNIHIHMQQVDVVSRFVFCSHTFVLHVFAIKLFI